MVPMKPKPFVIGDVSCSDQTYVDNSQSLANKTWFHGPISRKESELLVIKDGDFLVRESQGLAGQYVLTGMQGGVRKHLLLVDPEGKVSQSRTKRIIFYRIFCAIHRLGPKIRPSKVSHI